MTVFHFFRVFIISKLFHLFMIDGSLMNICGCNFVNGINTSKIIHRPDSCKPVQPSISRLNSRLLVYCFYVMLFCKCRINKDITIIRNS